jgi:hypothetical protein
MNKRIWGAILLGLSAVTAVSIASADSCKGVDLKIDNKSDRYLKVKYALYKCEGENERKEQFNNIEVQPREVKTIAANQNLQGCGGKKVEWIEYGYQVKCDSNWSSERTIRDRSFANAFCSSDTGKVFVVQLPTATCN